MPYERIIINNPNHPELRSTIVNNGFVAMSKDHDGYLLENRNVMRRKVAQIARQENLKYDIYSSNDYLEFYFDKKL